MCKSLLSILATKYITKNIKIFKNFNYKVVQNNYKSAQKPQSGVKIINFHITSSVPDAAAVVSNSECE